MNKIKPTHPRILAITLSTRGLGFAVLEGQDTLVNWGGKRVKKGNNKTTVSLAKAEDLIVRYQPGVLVMEDNSAKSSRRSPRIRKLSNRLGSLASKHGVKVMEFSRKQVMQIFFADGRGTKHEIAEIIAERFPDELGSKLPPKRRAWNPENPRMDFFDAVALILTFRLRESKRTAYRTAESKEDESKIAA